MPCAMLIVAVVLFTLSTNAGGIMSAQSTASYDRSAKQVDRRSQLQGVELTAPAVPTTC